MDDSWQAHIETIKQFYEVCLNQHRPELLPELFTQDVVFHPNEQRGLDAFRVHVAGLREAFPDQHFTVEDLLVDDSRAAARWRMDATHLGPIGGVAATGKRVTQDAIVIYRFEGDKIAELWVQVDQLGVLRQMGVVPPAPRAGQAHPQARS